MDIDHLLRLPEVCRITGLSKASIYARIKVGTFPRPVKLGQRASAWLKSEVETWIAERVTARDLRAA